MGTIAESIKDFFMQFPSMGIFDFADIAIVSILFYYLYKFVRERRAGKLAIGILFILIIMMLSSFFEMYALNFIISNIVQVGIVGIIILFQAELRSFCASRDAAFITVSTSEPIEKMLFKELLKVGIMA